MTTPGCQGGPCIKYPAIGCNGPKGTAGCGLCSIDGWTVRPATSATMHIEASGEVVIRVAPPKVPRLESE